MLNFSHPWLLWCFNAGKALQLPLWSHASYYSCTVFWIKRLSLMMLHFCIQLQALKQPIHSSSHVTIPISKHSGTCLTFHCDFQVKRVQCLQEQVWKDTLFLLLKQMGDIFQLNDTWILRILPLTSLPMYHIFQVFIYLSASVIILLILWHMPHWFCGLSYLFLLPFISALHVSSPLNIVCCLL